jgi:hypothetical protein
MNDTACQAAATTKKLKKKTTIDDTACQAAAMTKKSILLLNTDHTYYHYNP